MAKAGRSARIKGHTYEREICALLKGLGYSAVTSRSESKRLDDKGGDIVTDFPFHIQAKAVERMSMPAHDLLKTMAEKLTDKPSVLFHKRNNKGTVISMTLETFLTLIK